MTIAYCVLSHRAPDQVERLVTRLQALSPNAVILVHHDPRGEPLHGAAAAAQIPARPADWGRWSLAAAMLRLFAAAGARDVGAAALISGQDYPVRDLSAWEKDVQDTTASAMLAAHPVAPLGPRGTPVPADDRYLRTWLRWYSLPRLPAIVPPLPPRLNQLRWRAIERVQPTACYRGLADGRHLLGVRRRRTPFDNGAITCFWGLPWMVLRRDAITLLARASTDQPELRRLYRHALIPDESYIHTILMNSALTVRQAELTFNHWTGQHGEQHPAVMDAGLIARARESGLPFARKFDLDTAAELFDTADGLVDDDRR